MVYVDVKDSPIDPSVAAALSRLLPGFEKKLVRKCSSGAATETFLELSPASGADYWFLFFFEPEMQIHARLSAEDHKRYFWYMPFEEAAYLHYVLDLWFERVVKPRLRGEACMVRYIDDFVLCFQYRADALRVQEALAKRLRRFSLTLEPTKTKLVEFGRYAQKHAGKRGRKRPETIYFLGFTLYCTRNRKGNFRVGFRTEKSRLRRALMRLQEQMRLARHAPIPEQVKHLNQMLRGHDAYYGIAGNLRSLLKVLRAVERYWRKMLSNRSWHGGVRWEQFQKIKSQFPLLRPKLHLSYPELQAIAKL